MARTLLTLIVVPTLLAAQLPDAEAAFGRGDFRAARAGYERVLAADSLNVRALYRLAILDSWDGKLTRSLQRFTRLRRLEPRDADFMVGQARVLSWAGKASGAEALYDSVLARSPGRADALAGRARTVAWSGDLGRAERLWRAALERHPDDAELLVGLAQTLAWKGQPALAETYAARARAVAPGDQTARDLERAVRAALRPEVKSSVDGAGDSDGNDFVAQEATVTTSFGPSLRGTIHGGWRYATDKVGDGTSVGAGGYAIAALGKGAVLRAGLGARRVAPDIDPARTAFTAQLGVGLRPGRYAAVSVGYARALFDETAGLMRQTLVVDAADLSFDVSPGAGWSISGGAGGAWLSDGNRRYSAEGAVLGPVRGGLQAGGFARITGYRHDRPGLYFAPHRFRVLEGRVVYQWQRHRWGLRADGGLGSQQVFRGSVHQDQAEWHVGLAVSRGWGANNEIALGGAVTNSAGATTSTGGRGESFRYRSLRLSFRQGL